MVKQNISRISLLNIQTFKKNFGPFFSISTSHTHEKPQKKQA